MMNLNRFKNDREQARQGRGARESFISSLERLAAEHPAYEDMIFGLIEAVKKDMAGSVAAALQKLKNSNW
jgi:DNA-binding SARP family transcriptional activator